MTSNGEPLTKKYKAGAEPADVEQAYVLAKQRYLNIGINTDTAIEKALAISISLNCWQADDVRGLETLPQKLDGGILATGNYIGVPRTAAELRQDLAKAISLIPGSSRVNLHASYGESGASAVDRDQLKPEHFSGWLKWAQSQRICLDFNPTYFSHPKATDGFTLAHPDDDTRNFWIRHGIACRRIAEHIAKQQGSPCLLNWWIPDGSKDLRVDRLGPRQRLAQAYDQIFDKSLGIDPKLCVDYVEGKLFGIGSEEYVVGSAEFYTGYAISRQVGLCLDMGHFHPTETIHDKIASHLLYIPRLLLHVSRPIRWDSDHVVIFNDDVRAVFQVIHRCSAWDKVSVALDYFDASINRVAAHVIGTRATRKAILYALLEPVELLEQHERAGRFTQRLALLEEQKSMPFGAVWDMLCLRAKVPVGDAWIPELEKYEESVQRPRK